MLIDHKEEIFALAILGMAGFIGKKWERNKRLEELGYFILDDSQMKLRIKYTNGDIEEDLIDAKETGELVNYLCEHYHPGDKMVEL